MSNNPKKDRTDTIEKRIRNLRKSRNLTQEALAEKFGVERQCISNYENGKRTLYTDILIKYAQFFNVSIDYIVFGSEKDVSASLCEKVLQLRQELDNILQKLKQPTVS